MSIITMILTNQKIKYHGQVWQPISSYDDGTVELINDANEITYAKQNEIVGGEGNAAVSD